MTTDRTHGINRRRFLIAGLCAGGAAVIGSGLFKLWPRGTSNSTVVFRNPAYNLRQDANGAVLVCHTPKGETVAFRMDAPAVLFWEQAPTAEAFSADGKHVTVDQILATISPHFKGQPDAEWQHDARQFANETLKQGVLLGKDAKVRMYIPPHDGTLRI